MSATIAKPKPSLPKAAAFGEHGEADLFVIREMGFFDAAEAWLKRRGVAERVMGLYCAVIDLDEDKSIRLPEWEKRVRRVLNDFNAAGWLTEYDSGSENVLYRAFSEVYIGVSFDCHGFSLWPRWPDQKRFIETISETCYHHVTFLGIPDPAEVEAVIERIMRDRKKEVEKAMKTKTKSKPKPQRAIKPATKVQRPDVPQSIAEEIHRSVRPKGVAESKAKATAIDAPPTRPRCAAVGYFAKKTQDPRPKAKGGAPGTPGHGNESPHSKAIDVPSVPAPCSVILPQKLSSEKLTSEERRELSAHEKTIERAGHAFLDLGRALAEIQAKRLYRAEFASFELYLDEKWKLEKSVAYRCMKAAEIFKSTSAIADKLKLRLTNEAQFRALEKFSDAPSDLEAILKRAARKLNMDANGVKIPTAKILAEAVREETQSPDDLKREAERRREKAGSREPPEKEKLTAYTAVGGIRVDDLPEEVRHPWMTADPHGGRWNNQPHPQAFLLYGVRGVVERLVGRHLGQFEENVRFRADLASLLRGLAGEIESDQIVAKDRFGEPIGQQSETPSRPRRRAK
jgi:hypothetical protein